MGGGEKRTSAPLYLRTGRAALSYLSLIHILCQKHKVIIKYMETDKDHIHYMIETEPTTVSYTHLAELCFQVQSKSSADHSGV